MSRVFHRIGWSQVSGFGLLAQDFRHNAHGLGRFAIGLVAVALATGAVSRSEDSQQKAKVQEKKFMSEVSGEFDVKIVPADTGDDKMGMMLLDKKYHGDLSGTGVGRMLTGMTEVKTSGVYVAIERVKGKLKGAEGSFLVHHTGIMAQGKQSLSIKVVPDSGTGELAGIEGEMHIKIEGGKHFYRFEYSLGEKK